MIDTLNSMRKLKILLWILSNNSININKQNVNTYSKKMHKILKCEASVNVAWHIACKIVYFLFFWLPTRKMKDFIHEGFKCWCNTVGPAITCRSREKWRTKTEVIDNFCVIKLWWQHVLCSFGSLHPLPQPLNMRSISVDTVFRRISDIFYVEPILTFEN